MATKEGKLCHELEIPVPASEAWELYSTLRLVKLVEENFPIFQKIDVVQGDGGAGTILHFSFVPGTPGLSDFKEKYTKMDNEKHVKESEVIEGGYLDLGFTLYRVRFEIIDKDINSCIVRSTIEYELKEEFAANASYVSVDAIANMALLAKNHLTKPKP